jgi:hypothetical protein
MFLCFKYMLYVAWQLDDPRSHTEVKLKGNRNHKKRINLWHRATRLKVKWCGGRLMGGVVGIIIFVHCSILESLIEAGPQ